MVSSAALSGPSRYRLSRLLGRGGMAEVFEAFAVGDHGFERRVALKRILPEATAEAGFLERFVEEARIASSMHHPNLVGVLDFGVLDGRPFHVLELVNGLDLGRLVERARQLGRGVPVEVALFIAVEVAHGLAHAHAARDARGRPLGVVHRDVSPGNILVSWGGDVKLTDFGIALAAGRKVSTRIGQARGKLAFMAPEQLLGSGVDPRSDLFSLAAVLHWLLVGQSPLEDEAMRRRVLSGGDAPVSPEVPGEIARVLADALAFDRSRRPQSAAELAEACGTLLARRLQVDPRTLMARWTSALEPAAAAPEPSSPLEALMEVALLLEGPEQGPLRRFASTAHQPPTVEEATAVEVCVVRPPATPQRPLSAPLVRPVSDDPLLGATIGAYRILELLGRGALARVYSAVHLGLGRTYAFKVLAGAAAKSARSAERLRREALALGRIRHPNVVEVTETGVTPDGQPFLVMELVEGESLKEVMRREGALPAPRVVAIARQITRALAAAHAEGVVHRDLKPSNVMLVDAGGLEHVKVVDFGLARLGELEATRITMTDMLVGTPRFMAPEQILGASSAGPAADLYALGGVMYALLAGRPPFLGKALEVVEKQLQEAPPPLDSDTGLEPLIARLLAKRPEDRPPSAEAVLEILEELGPPEATALIGPKTEVGPKTERGARAEVGLSEPAQEVSVLEVLPTRAVGAPGVVITVSPRRRRVAALAAGALLLIALSALGGAVIGRRAQPVTIDPLVPPPPPPAVAIVAAPRAEPAPAEEPLPEGEADLPPPEPEEVTPSPQVPRRPPARREATPAKSAPEPEPAAPRPSPEARLAQVARRLSALSRSAAADRVEPLEERYLELRASLARSGEGPGFHRALEALERDLAEAAR